MIQASVYGLLPSGQVQRAVHPFRNSLARMLAWQTRALAAYRSATMPCRASSPTRLGTSIVCGSAPD